jgi:hypothetical protein
MGTKEEFKKLLEEICDVVFKESAKPKGSKFEIPIITKNVLYMLINLNQQIEEQREQVKRFEEQVKRAEEKIKILIKEYKGKKKTSQEGYCYARGIYQSLKEQGHYNKEGIA